jgi:hypothetical protein
MALGIAILSSAFAGSLGLPDWYGIWVGRALLALGAWIGARRAFRDARDPLHTLRMAMLVIVVLALGGAYQLGRHWTGECDDHVGCETAPDREWHVSVAERFAFVEHGLLLMGVPTLLAAFRAPKPRDDTQVDRDPF